MPNKSHGQPNNTTKENTIMSDPNTDKRKFITLPIDEDLHRALKEKAEKDDRSIVSQIRIFVKQGLEEQKAA